MEPGLSVCRSVHPSRNKDRNVLLRHHYVREYAGSLCSAYETCVSIASENGNADKVRDAWGNAIRYRSPGKYNTGTYDLYSIGRDKAVGNGDDSTKKSPGLGDDIANFKNPKAK